MIRPTLFLLGLLALSCLVVWVARTGGSVVIFAFDHRIELSAALLAVLGFLAVIVSVFVTRIYDWLLHLPNRARYAQIDRNRNQALALLTRGLNALASQNAKDARDSAKKLQRLIGEHPLTSLLLAQVEKMEGRPEAAREQFRRLTQSPEAAATGWRGLTELARSEENAERLFTVAEEAYRQKPKEAWAAHNYIDACFRAERFEEGIRAAAKAIKNGIRPSAPFRRLRAVGLYLAGEHAFKRKEWQSARHQLVQALKLQPEFIPAYLLLARTLLAMGEKRVAARYLEQAWKLEAHPGVLTLYLQTLEKDSPAKRLQRMEKLVAQHPEHEESHLALAEAALTAENWEKAATALNSALALRQSHRGLLLRARLAEDLKSPPEDIQEWLKKAGSAAPDPIWACNSCGAHSEEWSAYCPKCASLDSLGWTYPELRLPEKKPSSQSALHSDAMDEGLLLEKEI